MVEKINLNCQQDRLLEIRAEQIRKHALSVPEVYCKSEEMIFLAKQIKKECMSVFCELPFCNTVEMEALGAEIYYAKDGNGPRVRNYKFTNLDELLALPEMDLETGRVSEVLKACKELCEQGETVLLEISGPITIWNGLLDPSKLFLGMRKNQEKMALLYEKMKQDLLRYIQKAYDCGVRYISYADPVASMHIIGPQASKKLSEMFTYDFLKRVEQETEEDLMILLCPKTTAALLASEKATLALMELDEAVSYEEACVLKRGKSKFAGQMCVRNKGKLLEDKEFKEVRLC